MSLCFEFLRLSLASIQRKNKKEPIVFVKEEESQQVKVKKKEKEKDGVNK